MTTIIFSGAPSVGKTTLARALSNILHIFGHGVNYVEEVSKRFIKTIRPITVQHYLLSAKTQLDIQQKGRDAEFNVIETPIFLYGLYARGALRPWDSANVAEYEELKRLCNEETRSYHTLGYKLFHIRSDHPLENDILRYAATFVSSYVYLTSNDLMRRLESVLSYLDLDWWCSNDRCAGVEIERACENAEMSVLNDHCESEG